MRPRRRFGRLWVALAAALCAVSVQAEEISLTLPEARSAAARLLAAGRPQEALALSEGVLQGAPDDVPALVMKSRALRDLGRTDAALETARQVWRVAESDEDRFYAALVTAQAQASGGRRGIAQFWLRRAAQIAPDDGLKALAIRDFRHVRSTTPWRLALAFYAEHSDNLNDAPETNTVPYGRYLTVTRTNAVPLSGLRHGVRGKFTYTIPISAQARTHLGLFAGLGRVRLSDESRQFAWADAEDYRTETLGGDLRLETRSAAGDRIASAGLLAYRQWQGGQALADVARLDLGVQQRLATGLIGSAGVSFETVRRKDNTRGSSDTVELSLGLERRLPHGTLGLSLTTSDTDSAIGSIARQTDGIGLRYAFARPLPGGLLPALTLDWRSIDYDAPPPIYVTGARQSDREWQLGLDVILTEAEYFGFAPTLGVSFTDRQSNYRLYESRSTDLRLGLKSVF